MSNQMKKNHGPTRFPGDKHQSYMQCFKRTDYESNLYLCLEI